MNRTAEQFACDLAELVADLGVASGMLVGRDRAGETRRVVAHALAAQADRHALEHQRRQAPCPSRCRRRPRRRRSGLDVVEEDLVELGLAGDLAQSPRTVTPAASIGTMNIVMPLCLGTSASVRASSSPYEANWAFVVHTFWPVRRQLPSSCRRARVCTAARSEPGRGLGEQLAPDLVAVEHRPEVARLLLLGAVGDDRRPEHADADRVEDARGPSRARSPGCRYLLDRAEALSAELLRPCHAGEAALGQLALPCAARREDLRLVLDCARSLEDQALRCCCSSQARTCAR